MTTNGISAIALGVAALVIFPLSAAYADTAAPATPNAATPSLSEPSPTPSWAEGGPLSATNPTATNPQRSRAHARHIAYRDEHRYVRSGSNFVADTAHGVVGGVEDLGSVAAYPVYCFPNYGSCSVRLPYRP